MIPTVIPAPCSWFPAICCVFLLQVGVVAESRADSERLSTLRDGYFAAVARLHERYQPLNDGYLNALSRLRDAAIQEGNLDNALAAKSEQETFTKSDYDEVAFEKRLSEWSELNRVQTTYLRQRRTLEAQVEPAMTELARRFDQELEKLLVELTKSDRLDEAIEVKKAQERFRADPRNTAMLGDAVGNVKLIRGKVLFVTKGELELYHNGEPISYRDTYDGTEADIRVTGESMGAADFHAGDLLVVRARSSAAFRGIILAIVSEDKSTWIPVRPEQVRHLGVDPRLSTITPESVEAIKPGGVGSGGTDGVMLDEWRKTGLPSAESGGSQWILSDTKNEWHAWALILTPEIVRPLNVAN